MPHECLPRSHEHSLGGPVFGRISRVPEYEWGFKMDPHRAGGIRQPPVSEGVREQQIAKLVMDLGGRNGQHGQQGGAHSQCCQPYNQDGESTPLSQPAECPFDGCKPARAKLWNRKRQPKRNNAKPGFDRKKHSCTGPSDVRLVA